jgi:hypothetical protein
LFCGHAMVSTTEVAPANQARPSIEHHQSSDFAKPSPKAWRQAPKGLPQKPQPKLRVLDSPAS